MWGERWCHTFCTCIYSKTPCFSRDLWSTRLPSRLAICLPPLLRVDILEARTKVSAQSAALADERVRQCREPRRQGAVNRRQRDASSQLAVSYSSRLSGASGLTTLSGVVVPRRNASFVSLSFISLSLWISSCKNRLYVLIKMQLYSPIVFTCRLLNITSGRDCDIILMRNPQKIKLYSWKCRLYFSSKTRTLFTGGEKKVWLSSLRSPVKVLQNLTEWFS